MCILAPVERKISRKWIRTRLFFVPAGTHVARKNSRNQMLDSDAERAACRTGDFPPLSQRNPTLGPSQESQSLLCLLSGEDRKWWTLGPDDAIDPERT